MDTNVLRFVPAKSPPFSIYSNPSNVNTRTQRRISLKISSSDSTGSEDIPKPPTIKPPDAVEIRFKRGSRRRRGKRVEDDEGAGAVQPLKAQSSSSEAPNNWEDMSLAEKAIELYMGEKGLLFWLNKFAYASIFIVIGGWVLFRFVGPALNLYQLDTPPLAPSSMFKG